ncbi:MAG: SpoIIE family protein phosphatase, partial [Bacteroidota bacterium]
YRTWWAYICYFIFAAGLIYLLVYLNSRRLVAKNKKLEEIIRIRTQEVVEQKEEIQEQKETIETILDDLNDSISYAKQIQEAILPPEEVLKENFDDSFILFKPRNVVSGDFYWATRVKEWLVFTVADCTGHGVPGAFMSMLGISFLNEIVRNKEITRAGEILDHLINSVIEALKQKDSLIAMDMRPDHKIAVKDGMDIVLCVYNTETGMLQFSGANNPLFIVKNNGELVEIKPDKQPVAIHIEMHPFTNNEVSLEKGDRLYLITDGYQDQFGGEKNKKYKIVNLKQKFTENYRLPMNEQLDSLHNTFESWKGDLEQIDDVTIMGVRI